MKNDFEKVLGSSDSVDVEHISNNIDKGNLVISGAFGIQAFKPDGTMFHNETVKNTTMIEFAEFVLTQVLGSDTVDGTTGYPFGSTPTYGTSAGNHQYYLSLITAGTPATNMVYTDLDVTTSLTEVNGSLTPGNRQPYLNTATDATTVVQTTTGNEIAVTNFVDGGTDNRPTWTCTADIDITGAILMLSDSNAWRNGDADAANKIVAAKTFTTVNMTVDDTLKVAYTYKLTVS